MKPTATFRQKLDDFKVEEIPAFAPSGQGEHLYLWITKEDLTTDEVVRRISRALGVEARDVGYAGMKDRRAITTQMLSLPYPFARPESDALALQLPGISVAQATRHQHKLKPGHLKGNRFTIVLRDVSDVGRAEELLLQASATGVPNAFGPQRFGRDGDNAERALAWLVEGSRAPRDRRNRRLIFSALQAHLFNRVLERRQRDGTWMRPLAGDLVKKRDTGGLFVCVDPGVDGDRAERGEICPTGPIFGAKMRWPEGEPARIEREILAESPGTDKVFDEHRALGEGSRRPFALYVSNLVTEKLKEDERALRIEFVLPKGGYATTFLACAVALHEQARRLADELESG